jgi:hypothetical protein
LKPRATRWLSISDVTDIVLQRSNKVADRLRKLDRRYQVQHVRRLVLRAERRDEEQITKRVSGDIFVRFTAVESLLPIDAATITSLEIGQVKQATETRKLWRHVGSHGATLREHEKRMRKVERKQEILARAQAELMAVEAED